MPKLPIARGNEVVAAFKKAGFSLDRIVGSHHILKKDGHPNLISVPVHAGKALKPGTLRGLIRAAGLSVEQFIELLG